MAPVWCDDKEEDDEDDCGGEYADGLQYMKDLLLCVAHCSASCEKTAVDPVQRISARLIIVPLALSLIADRYESILACNFANSSYPS